jgi:intein/homing endonuclease
MAKKREKRVLNPGDFTNNYFKKRFSANKNIILVITGPTGCLSGDTKLFGQDKTLEELYKENKRIVKTTSIKQPFNRQNQGCYYPISSNSEISFSGEKEVFELELENGNKVKATEDHKFFVFQKGKRIEKCLKDLKIGDKIVTYDPKYFYDKAKRKSKLNTDEKFKDISGYKKLCSKCNNLMFLEKRRAGSKPICKSCKNPIESKRKFKGWYIWEDNIIKNYYYDKNKEFLMELLPQRTWPGILHRAQRLKIKRWGELKWGKNKFSNTKNPMFDEKAKEKARNSLKKFYNLHPEMLLNARLKRDKMTLIEKKMANLLDSMGIKYEWNKVIRTKSTFRFPDFKIGNKIIECDGLYWHKDINKDRLRQKELEDLGFEVMRFNDKEILNNLEEVKKCLIQRLKV